MKRRLTKHTTGVISQKTVLFNEKRVTTIDVTAEIRAGHLPNTEALTPE
jgi:hypothetical protein